MTGFEKDRIYVSKYSYNTWEEYKVLDRTDYYVTTDHGKFRVSEFVRDNGDIEEYFIDTRSDSDHETFILASDSYDNVGMDRIKLARKVGISSDFLG